jgi:hypothetical protein
VLRGRQEGIRPVVAGSDRVLTFATDSVSTRTSEKSAGTEKMKRQAMTAHAADASPITAIMARPRAGEWLRDEIDALRALTNRLRGDYDA